ncbi:MAG: efflux RND transporter permease subunit, partial [Desulfamplus sp.]|nr:efflux RND transporter permease subunit [Desulfamplus sp.]
LIVIFLVMGIKNALLVSLAIPMSMLLSFTVLHFMGITLNMVVLFSLTLALGMLVDNAIVIVENIHRFVEQGASPADAAMKATSEVAWPVIGSTMTTLAAFSPMLFWPGIMGEFMGYLPMTLIITLTSSLFVALVINPALASLLIKPGIKKCAKNQKNGKMDEIHAPGLSDMKTDPLNGCSREEYAQYTEGKTMEDISRDINKPAEIKGFILTSYSRMLSLALTVPFTVMGVAFSLLVMMIQLWLIVVGLEKPVEFFPEIDPGGIYVNVDVPEGADLDYIDTILGRVERALGDDLAPRLHTLPGGGSFTGPSDMKNIKNIYTRATIASDGGSAFSANTPNHVGLRFLDLEERWRSTHDTVDEIRQRIMDIPGGKITIAKEEDGPPTGAPINIEVSGDDFEMLGEIARKIRNIISDLPHVHDVRDDFVEGIPSVQVSVDRQKAALFGLTTDGIGYALKSAYNGLEVSSFREGSEDYDITVQLGEENRRVVDVLQELMLPTPTGQMVPLSTLATVSFTGSIGDIVRINNERVVTVKANVDENKVPGPVMREQAEAMLHKFDLPPGYKVKFTGEFEFQQESEEFLSKAFLVALLLIFLILVSMFNSVIQPFVIMTSVILSLGGAFLGLTVFRSPFGIIMTGVGVISLAGVVVNNAIVLIDYINKLRQRGLELRDAVVAAGATRLRPVLLTAVTTILGLIPMVSGVSYDFHHWTISWVSESSQWWRSMAVVVIFGLVVATFLTLVVVPTLYYTLERAGDIRRELALKVKKAYWKPYPWLAGDKAP